MLNFKIDIERNQFLLTGDIDSIWSQRNIKFYLKDFLEAFNTGSEIIIPINDSAENIAIKLDSILKKYKVPRNDSDEIKNLLKIHQAEEDHFESFSEKALNIRNNNNVLSDLESFQNNLVSHFSRSLYRLQLLSAYHLAFSQNACNFSVPGSGKTSTVYAAYSYLKKQVDNPEKYVSRILVVGPLSSFGPWEQEYYECFGRRVESKRLTGISKSERTDYLYSERPCELTLISYQALAYSCDDIERFLKKKPTMVVLDEAHRIKNTEGGIWSQAALQIAKYATSRVVLTGTPAPNGYEDLYNLYRFIWPTKDIIKYQLYQLKDMSSTNNDSRVDQLIRNISPFFVRIKKSHLENLPEAIDHTPVKIKMGEVQKQIYRYIEDNYIQYFSNTSQKESFISAVTRARMIRLMQVATNPALLCEPLSKFMNNSSPVNDLDLDQPMDSQKLEFSDFNLDPSDYENQLNEKYVESKKSVEKIDISDSTFIDDYSIYSQILNYRKLEIPSKFIEAYNLVKKIIERKERVIIWTTFVQNIIDLGEYLSTQGVKSEALYGAIPVNSKNNDVDIYTRERIIAQFHEKDCPYQVLIANPFAVGESISLHKACNNAIYLERTFNAAHFVQSKDRIHRVGGDETKTVNYYFLLSSESIDETIHDRLEIKTKRMTEIMEKMPIPLFEENLDFESDYSSDIEALLKDYHNRTTT